MIIAESVQRLIRCKLTGRYLGPNGWTYDPAEANHYVDTFEAVRDCVGMDLRDVEFVLRAPGADDDLFSSVIR